MKFYVHKASSVGDKNIEDSELHIKKIIPEFNNDKYIEDIKYIEEFYRYDALDVFDILKHLPQATLHQLIIIMLQDKSNIYERI